MAVTESNIIANELEKTKDKIGVLLEREGTFFQKAISKRPAEIVSARDMRVPLEIRPGGRFGHFNPEGGDLGRGDGPSFEKATLPATYLKMAVEWTRKSDWGTDNARKAILSTFRHLVATSMAEYRRNLDSLCMTNGDGVVATVTSVSTSGNQDTLTLNTDGFDTRLLRYGQYHSIYNAGLTTQRTYGNNNGTRINSVEAKFNLIDIAAKTARASETTGATVATDKVVVSGLSGASPVSLLGVLYHHNDASTGTWMGLDRSLIPEIRANSVDAASASLALPMARLAVNKIGNRVGGDMMQKVVAWMHPCQQQSYEELGQLVSVQQLNSGGNKDLNMYFGGKMQLAGAPVETSFSWNKFRIDFVNYDAWGRSEISPAGYYTDKNGRKFFEVRSSDGGVAAADIFYLSCAMGTFMNNPAAAAYIKNLPVPAGY